MNPLNLSELWNLPDDVVPMMPEPRVVKGVNGNGCSTTHRTLRKALECKYWNKCYIMVSGTEDGPYMKMCYHRSGGRNYLHLDLSATRAEHDNLMRTQCGGGCRYEHKAYHFLGWGH